MVYEEITTLEEYRASIRRGRRIVISDAGTSKVHDPCCYTLSEDAFVEKVVESARKNGRYISARNTRVAESQGGVKCRACYG